jgi:hypothetical protein
MVCEDRSHSRNQGGLPIPDRLRGSARWVQAVLIDSLVFLLGLCPGDQNALKLGLLLASVLKHKSKRVGHGAGFTRVRQHANQRASRHIRDADRSRNHPGPEPRTADHTSPG